MSYISKWFIIPTSIASNNLTWIDEDGKKIILTFGHRNKNLSRKKNITRKM